MKKIITFTLILISFACIISSCDSSETYADKLKNQKKAMKRIQRDSSFVFISDYPENGVFGEKQFYKDPSTGAYYHVIDSGNGNRAVVDETTVLLRYKEAYFFASDTEFEIPYSNMSEDSGLFNDLITFRYKGTGVTYMGNYDGSSNYYFLSKILAMPLEHVGEGAIIKFIIPFETGSYYQQYTIYEPAYIGYVRYSFQPR